LRIARCPSAKVVNSKKIKLPSGRVVVHSTHSCAGATLAARQDYGYPPAPNPNVCAATCSYNVQIYVKYSILTPLSIGTTSCNKVTGILPPIQDDCDTIEDAISILSGELTSSTFTVDPNHMVALSFGTCEYFFENTGTVSIDECWASFVSLTIGLFRNGN